MTLREAIDEMTPAKVEAWLETLDSEFKFMSQDCHECLFAKYLTERISISVDVGGKLAHHGGAAFDNGRGGFKYAKPQEVNLPEWAVDVIIRFDSNGVKSRGLKSSLRILRDAGRGHLLP